MCCGYSLEVPRQGASNEYPQHMFYKEIRNFVLSPREREKRDRRDSKRDEREGQGRKRNRNEREETDEINIPPLPLSATG